MASTGPFGQSGEKIVYKISFGVSYLSASHFKSVIWNITRTANAVASLVKQDRRRKDKAIYL